LQTLRFDAKLESPCEYSFDNSSMRCDDIIVSKILYTTYHNIMPPKSARIGGPAGRPSNRGYMQNVFEQLSSPDNRSVVISVSFFAVSGLAE